MKTRNYGSNHDMSSNKKPRKKYVKGKVLKGGHLKIFNSIADTVEISALMTLSLLKEGKFNQKMGLDLVMFLNECHSILHSQGEDPDEQVAPLYAALSSISDRHDRSGKWGASGEELRALLEGLPPMFEAYRSATRSQALLAEQRSNVLLMKVQNAK